MPERIASVTPLGAGAWRVDLSGTAPWRAYLDGRLHRTVDASPLVVEGYPDHAPPLEVLDATDTDTPASVDHPPYLTLQWRASTGAAAYRVDEYASGSWVARAQVPETGAGYYRYETPVLADQAPAAWRVVALDGRGNESPAATVTATPVRHPDPPVAAFAYSNTTHQLTVTLSP